MKGFLYLIVSKSTGKKYIGSTNDIYRRLAEHNRGKSRYTSSNTDWVIKYVEEYQSIHEARLAEQLIKKNKRLRTEFYTKAELAGLSSWR